MFPTDVLPARDAEERRGPSLGRNPQSEDKAGPAVPPSAAVHARHETPAAGREQQGQGHIRPQG